MHLTLPQQLITLLAEAGWIKQHPIALRPPQWPDTIVMFYAPREEAETCRRHRRTACLLAAGVLINTKKEYQICVL